MFTDRRISGSVHGKKFSGVVVESVESRGGWRVSVRFEKSVKVSGHVLTGISLLLGSDGNFAPNSAVRRGDFVKFES